MATKNVTIKDKSFSLLLSEEEIQQAIGNVAKEINKKHKGKAPLFLCVLNGSFLFSADLLKQVNIECEITFIKMASYLGTSSTGNVTTLIGLDQELEGRNIIVLEDIVDTGLTLENLMQQLKRFNPLQVEVATLLYKPEACVGKYKPNYVGKEIENNFVVGYGLDYDGLGRNLREVYKLTEA